MKSRCLQKTKQIPDSLLSETKGMVELRRSKKLLTWLDRDLKSQTSTTKPSHPIQSTKEVKG